MQAAKKTACIYHYFAFLNSVFFNTGASNHYNTLKFFFCRESALISIMFADNELGTIQKIKKLER